jgi:peptide chain release factor 3
MIRQSSRSSSTANLGNLADDRDGSPVFMAKSGWELRYTAERWPKISFSATRERHH